jgi:hypothetical protein
MYAIDAPDARASGLLQVLSISSTEISIFTPWSPLQARSRLERAEHHQGR